MARYVVNGSNVTVIFEYTALIEKVQAVVGDAAHSLWNSGHGNHGTDENPRTWNDLTNTEKLNIVDDFIKFMILSVAKDFRLGEGRLMSDAELEELLRNEYSLG